MSSEGEVLDSGSDVNGNEAIPTLEWAPFIVYGRGIQGKALLVKYWANDKWVYNKKTMKTLMFS